MNRSTIVRGFTWVAAAIAVVILVFAIASAVGPASPSRGCCDSAQNLGESVEGEYPNSSRGNPMDLQNGTSPEQDADEGTLNQGPSEVDGEVGAGEHQVVEPPRPASDHTPTADWVAQGIFISIAVVVVAIGVGLILLPSDRIPWIGPPGSSDG